MTTLLAFYAVLALFGIAAVGGYLAVQTGAAIDRWVTRRIQRDRDVRLARSRPMPLSLSDQMHVDRFNVDRDVA